MIYSSLLILHCYSLGMLKLERDEEALNEEMCLDGCYVIKTDLKEKAADK